LNEPEERRQHPRRVCSPENGATLRINKVDYQVVDISEGGLRFVNNGKMKLTGWVSGRLTVGNRRPIDIDGIIVRNRENEIGIHLVTSLERGV